MKISSASAGIVSGVPSNEVALNAPAYTITTSATTAGNLSLTIPAAGPYHFDASLRYYSQTSAATDGYYVAQLSRNGVTLSNTQILLYENTVPAVNSGTCNPHWYVTVSAGDVIAVQVFRAGVATWTTSEIRCDPNGYSKFGYHP